MGHPSNKVMKKIFPHLPILTNVCEACTLGKMSRLPFSNSDHIPEFLLDLVHDGVWGPTPVISRSGFRYFVTFIENKSNAIWIYFLKKKSEVLSTFKEFYFLLDT